MYKKIRRLILVPATAIFATVAFASALPGGEQDTALQVSDPFSQDAGSMAMEQQPLLLAKSSKASKGSGKNKGSKGSKGSKTKIYYCKVKLAKPGSKPGKPGKPAKAKTKKGSSLAKVNKKIDKCNLKDKYECFLGKCEDNPSYS